MPHITISLNGMAGPTTCDILTLLNPHLENSKTRITQIRYLDDMQRAYGLSSKSDELSSLETTRSKKVMYNTPARSIDRDATECVKLSVMEKVAML